MKQPRAWQRMLSGRRLDLLDPTPVDIEIEDIAHGLAFVARWNGQTMGDYAYSVAEHSLLVEEIFRMQNMISPVKAAVGPGYGALDDRLTAAIHLRFGLPAQIPVTVKRKIKKADKLSAWLEAVQIAGFSKAEADKFFGKQDPALIANLSIRLRPPVEVRNEFTARYQALSDQL